MCAVLKIIKTAHGKQMRLSEHHNMPLGFFWINTLPFLQKNIILIFIVIIFLHFLHLVFKGLYTHPSYVFVLEYYVDEIIL